MAHSPYIVQTLNRIETVQAMEVPPLYASTEPRNCITNRELKGAQARDIRSLGFS
jgi:hypothetical protein